MGVNIMVKRAGLAALILGVLDALLILNMLLFEKDDYVYGRFDLNLDVFIVNIIAILAVNAIIALIIFLCRKRIKALIASLIPAGVICAYCLTVFLSFTSVGAFWHSETDDYTQFDKIDPYLDSAVSIAGLKLSDITNLEIENVENFCYTYQSQIGCERFVFSGEFYFSDESYDSVKKAFSNACEFENVVLPPEDQIELGITGYYDFNREILQYESKTTVDEWDGVYIGFNDSDRCIHFNLRGYCFT